MTRAVVVGLAAAAALPVAAAPPTVAAVHAPWVYRSTTRGYHLTLPSDSWREPPGKPQGSDAFFVNATPDMHASVMLVRSNTPAEELDKAAAYLRGKLESSPVRRASAKSRSGTNAAGNRYHYFTASEPTPSGEQVFIGNSVTWNPHTKLLVVVLFEGLQKAKSEPEKAAELASFQNASDAICLSVE